MPSAGGQGQEAEDRQGSFDGMPRGRGAVRHDVGVGACGAARQGEIYCGGWAKSRALGSQLGRHSDDVSDDDLGLVSRPLVVGTQRHLDLTRGAKTTQS